MNSLERAYNLYFNQHQAQLFGTLRVPKARTHDQAQAQLKRLIYSLQDHYRAKVSAIGVAIITKDPANSHVHFIAETDSQALRNLDNRPDSTGKRPALLLKRKLRVLDHANALDISPIEDRPAVNDYLTKNMVDHGDQAELIHVNRGRLDSLKRAA